VGKKGVGSRCSVALVRGSGENLLCQAKGNPQVKVDRETLRKKNSDFQNVVVGFPRDLCD